MRLVDVKEISKAGIALELVDFQMLVSRHIDAARKCLKTQWLPTIQNIFLLVSELIVLSWWLCGEELYGLYSSHAVVRVIKSK
jgi:hypothetical protein